MTKIDSRISSVLRDQALGTERVSQREIMVNHVPIVVYSDGAITRPTSVWSKKRTEKHYGTGNKHKYTKVQIGGKNFFLHRLVAMAFLADFSESLEIDHIDGNPRHNQLSNLRLVTHAQNARSFMSPSLKTSKYRGVCWSNQAKKWRAEASPSGKRKNIGIFNCEVAAAIAYDRSVIEFGYSPESLNRFNSPELSMLSGAY